MLQQTGGGLGRTCLFPKVFFAAPTFQPSLTTLPMSIIHTPSHGHLSTLQGTGCKEDRSGMQHNAPTHLPHYCIFRLVELSLAQFGYIQSAEMQGSNQHKVWTLINVTSVLTSRPTKLLEVNTRNWNLSSWARSMILHLVYLPELTPSSDKSISS